MPAIAAASVAVINAVLICVTVFGVDLTPNQIGAIQAAVNAIIALAAAIVAAYQHTPATAKK
jgi:hypothetical protein